MKYITLLSALVASTYAHFEMVAPVPRVVDLGGMDEDQKVGPCGRGGEVPTKPRVPLSSLNNVVTLFFHWSGSNDIYLGKGENPTVFPYRIGRLPSAQMGQTKDVKINVSKAGLQKGDNITIQAVCHQEGFDIYQCADVYVD
ncbi:hypothetical protein BC833DRAFT_624965 [Globomyces pollinis-pini]|nr:hypothetical protein BC833DRAFT_624965 [Globomyces pollinis-pini]KAJ2989113.1 hypothetical protein HDV02_005176 [Globomyces sp. JEL0801]